MLLLHPCDSPPANVCSVVRIIPLYLLHSGVSLSLRFRHVSSESSDVQNTASGGNELTGGIEGSARMEHLELGRSELLGHTNNA